MARDPEFLEQQFLEFVRSGDPEYMAWIFDPKEIARLDKRFLGSSSSSGERAAPRESHA